MSEPEDHPDDPATGEPLPTRREKAMGFWEHLDELRGTIIKSSLVFVAFACVIGYFMTEFNQVLLWPLNTVKAEYPSVGIDLGTTTIMEGFNVVIQMCIVGGLILSSPFILFFIGQFVAPALTEKEMKMVLPLCGSALVLFLIGAAFSFFLLVPSTVRVSVQINQMLGYQLRWTPGSYYSLLTWLVLGVGGAFEFPLVIVLLVWIGIMSTAFLRKYRRHAIVVIFIIAAVVTPTPDPITQTIFALPLYVLYEISILASARIEKKRERRMIG